MQAEVIIYVTKIMYFKTKLLLSHGILQDLLGF